MIPSVGNKKIGFWNHIDQREIYKFVVTAPSRNNSSSQWDVPNFGIMRPQIIHGFVQTVQSVLSLSTYMTLIFVVGKSM